MVSKATTFWILGYVGELVVKVFCVANSVLMEAGLPNFSCELLPQYAGEAALDALRASFDGLLWCRG